MNGRFPRPPLGHTAGLAAALILAGLLNLVILLLIDTLIDHRGMRVPPSHTYHAIDFVRQPPKPRRSEPQKLVAANAPAGTGAPSEARPTAPDHNAGAKSRQKSPAPPTRKAEAKARQRPGSARPPADPAQQATASPRFAAPAGGTGVPVTSNTGSAPRVMAAPGRSGRGVNGLGGQAQGSESKDGSGVSGNSGVVVLSRVLPQYPPSARNRRIEGWVLVEITVSRAGSVSTAHVVDANPKRLFDQAALNAIRQWKFKPAYRQGQAVEQRVRQKIHFRLA